MILKEANTSRPSSTRGVVGLDRRVAHLCEHLRSDGSWGYCSRQDAVRRVRITQNTT